MSLPELQSTRHPPPPTRPLQAVQQLVSSGAFSANEVLSMPDGLELRPLSVAYLQRNPAVEALLIEAGACVWA